MDVRCMDALMIIRIAMDDRKNVTSLAGKCAEYNDPQPASHCQENVVDLRKTIHGREPRSSSPTPTEWLQFEIPNFEDELSAAKSKPKHCVETAIKKTIEGAEVSLKVYPKGPLGDVAVFVSVHSHYIREAYLRDNETSEAQKVAQRKQTKTSKRPAGDPSWCLASEATAKAKMNKGALQFELKCISEYPPVCCDQAECSCSEKLLSNG